MGGKHWEWSLAVPSLAHRKEECSMIRTLRKQRVFSVFQVVAGTAALSLTSACAQDPAFSEQARNITEEERQELAKARTDQNQEARVRKGTRDESPDALPQRGEGSATASTGDGGVSVAVNTTVVVGEGGSGVDDGGGGGASGGSRTSSEIEDKDGDGSGTGTKVGGETGGDHDDVTVGKTDPVPNETPNGGSGSGGEKPGAEVVIEKVQNPGKVDIMWVVDNSGSMDWAQSQLSAKFEAYASKLLGAGLDFQLGVTTTDVCNINWTTGSPVADSLCPSTSWIASGQKVNGKMVGPMRGEFITDSQTGKKVLSASDDFSSAFKRIARAGIDGSSFEHGLQAAKMAVQKAQSGVNGGFLRQDSFLSVIVLSDEEDQGVEFWCEDAWGRTSTTKNGDKDMKACKSGGNSPFLDAFGMSPYALMTKSDGSRYTDYRHTADDFVAYLNDPAIKGAGKFSVSAITGIRNGRGEIDCKNPALDGTGPLESGTNYIKAAGLTGGVVENICSDNWSSSLSNIGQSTAELTSRIELASGKKPFPGTLEVYVNGVKLASDRYVVDANGTYVSFKDVPSAGSRIKVSYKETVKQ